MKLTINLNNFKKAVSITEKITGKDINLPVLSNLLLETEKGLLKISATNLEIGIIAKIGAKIEKDGKTTVSAKIINNFISNLKGDKINLEIKDNFLILENKNHQTKIKTIPEDDFPIIPQTAKRFLFKIKTEIMKEIINKLNVSIALQNNRQEFTGVNIIYKEDKIKWATTDSFRLTEVVTKISKNEIGYQYNKMINKDMIIPFGLFLEINRSINENDQYIEFIFDQNQIFINIDDVMITSRLINGKYPDYQQIIPQNFKTWIKIKKDDLIQSIRLASIFSNSEILLKIKNKKEISVSSKEEEIGENKNILKGEVRGDDQEIILNGRYLLDGVSAINKNNVEIEIIDNEKPISIKDSDKNIVSNYILMPIKK